MRVGIGFDVHKLVSRRPLILGGIPIAHDLGLLGHSDADVLLHAITDAILGAAALGDIGTHFPDSDPAYAGADSKKLLATAVSLLAEAGYRVHNIDAVICAERPKIAPHISAMRERIAEILQVSENAVSIKATTTEKLGFVGREEGIACQAVATIEET